MNKVIIQNDTIECVLRSDVQATTQDIFEQVIELNYFGHIADDIAKAMAAELANESFMSLDLELSDKQKNVLKNAVQRIVDNAVNTYKGGIKTDERTKDTIEIVETKLKGIAEKVLRDIGQEINRGCIINSVAVKADAKSEKYNTIELHHSKGSGDVTVPTKGIFISSNCVELICNSVKVETI